MKYLRCLGAAVAVAAFALPASATTLVFTSGHADVDGSSTTTGTGFSDLFTFTTATPMAVSGSLTTHSLTSLSGSIVEDLDFTSVTLDGITFANHNTSDANEEFSIPSQFLASGNHTLTVSYNVDVASSANAAAYSGDIYLAPAAPVPEAATWAMFVCAFGMVGSGMRRRRPVALAINA